MGDKDKQNPSLPSESSGKGGTQGLGCKSGRTTWVLNRGTRVTVLSRKEKPMMLHSNAGKSGGVGEGAFELDPEG